MQNLRPLNTNSALWDNRIILAEILETGSYTLSSSIANYILIDVILQYGSTNWISVQTFRSSLFAEFPSICGDMHNTLFDCSYTAYISGSVLHVSNLTSNTRLLIRGIPTAA